MVYETLWAHKSCESNLAVCLSMQDATVTLQIDARV